MADVINDPMVRDNLLHFDHLPENVQSQLIEEAQDYFASEAEKFGHYTRYPNLDALDVAVVSGAVIPIIPDENFGIVSPIRGRYDITRLTDDQGSVPYLTPVAHEGLITIAEKCKKLAKESGFMELLADNGIADFRLAITSLTRTSHYQRQIGGQGKFVVRDTHGELGASVHETGHAFDIDHGALYVERKSDGIEVALNRDVDDESFAILARILPQFREIQQAVIDDGVNDGSILALHEIPDGWGVWHVSVPKQA